MYLVHAFMLNASILCRNLAHIKRERKTCFLVHSAKSKLTVIYGPHHADNVQMAEHIFVVFGDLVLFQQFIQKAGPLLWNQNTINYCRHYNHCRRRLVFKPV